jgi:hypothetical protein
MNAQTKPAPAHKNVFVALAAAQAEMEAVRKGSVNPAFKSRYADLSDVMQAVLPALNRHGLALFHTMDLARDQPAMVTVLSHGESDTQIECPVPLIVVKNDMQGMKSAITYAKRIGAESVTGTAPDDDDGNAAVAAAPRREEPRRAPPSEPARDALHDLDDFKAQIDATVFALGKQPSVDALNAYWKTLAPAIRADARVIAAGKERKDALLVDDEIPYAGAD